MVTVWQRSRRRLNSALVSAGLPRKSCQVGYGKFVVDECGPAVVSLFHEREEDVGLFGFYVDISELVLGP
jgi:hypothetical protein